MCTEFHFNPFLFLFPNTGFMVNSKPCLQARLEELNLPSQGDWTSSNPEISIREQGRTMRSSLTWPTLLVELGINDEIKATILISQTKLVIWSAIVSRWPALSSHGHKGQYNAKWTGEVIIQQITPDTLIQLLIHPACRSCNQRLKMRYDI